MTQEELEDAKKQRDETYKKLQEALEGNPSISETICMLSVVPNGMLPLFLKGLSNRDLCVIVAFAMAAYGSVIINRYDNGTIQPRNDDGTGTTRTNIPQQTPGGEEPQAPA